MIQQPAPGGAHAPDPGRRHTPDPGRRPEPAEHHDGHPVAAGAEQRPSARLARELGQLVRGLRGLHLAVREAGASPIDPAAAAVLARVGDDGPVRLSALAEQLCLDLSTVSRQVPALERRGWLVRETDPSDRRAQLVRLSEAGQQALADRRAAYARVVEQVLADWTPEQVAELATGLARFNASVVPHVTTSSGAPHLPAPIDPFARPAPAAPRQHQEAS